MLSESSTVLSGKVQFPSGLVELPCRGPGTGLRAPLGGCAAEPEKNVAICVALVGGHRAPPPTLEPSVLSSLSAASGCCLLAPVCCLSAALPSRTHPPCLRQKKHHSMNASGTVAVRVFSRSVSSN